MKTLSTSFTGKGEVSGVRFDQIFRQNDVCVYYRSKRLFEVIRIRHQREKKDVNLGGVFVNFEARERYPKGNDWTPDEICTHNAELALESVCRILGVADNPLLLDRTAFNLTILPARLRNQFLILLGTAEASEDEVHEVVA